MNEYLVCEQGTEYRILTDHKRLAQRARGKNFLFASLIFTHNFVSGLTNLLMWHDLLVSFNAVLPLVLLLSMVSDKRQREQNRSDERF